LNETKYLNRSELGGTLLRTRILWGSNFFTVPCGTCKLEVEFLPHDQISSHIKRNTIMYVLSWVLILESFLGLESWSLEFSSYLIYQVSGLKGIGSFISIISLFFWYRSSFSMQYRLKNQFVFGKIWKPKIWELEAIFIDASTFGFGRLKINSPQNEK